jgi:hypothetical protein
MRRFMYGTHALLHISVFLFFWALSDFFSTVHHHFGVVIRYAFVASAIVYMLLSISPMIFSNSIYNTPMTHLLRAGFIILRIIIRSPLLCLRWCHNQPLDLTGLPYYKGMHLDRAHLYSIKANEQAEKIEPYAMDWLFTENVFSDDDMDKFLEGLPGYMSSNRTEKGQLDQYLTADHILSRIKEHFITCATSVELSDEASTDRVSFCVKALSLIFQYSRQCKYSVPYKLKKELRRQRTYIQGLIDDFQTLCGMDDPMIALRASCIRGLAVQGLLSQLIPQDSNTSYTTDSPRFPVTLLPIYRFFFPKDELDNTVWQLDYGDAPDANLAKEVKRMWESLLYDGPLANLTTLAQAVRGREDAPPSSLSFCWKALDILLMQLGTIHLKESTPAQSDFDKLHKDTRTYVHNEERGFLVTPLLDKLDAVARGRRLLMVLSGHPRYHKFHNRADVVFGDEYLQNGDLLEAFAHYLPDFISKNSSEVCKDFMEQVVCHDDLWISLRENLWNTQNSDSPIPDKLRVFEDCCTVIDLAFSVLEDSRNVDWRAPEFGSLSQYFQSFITDCFQGAFVGIATSFRVGIIKARFCKALLAQFWRDLERERTVSFRSQWDVASLARLIYTLGLRDKEDAEYWNSYLDGGHIGAEFRAKAREMIETTARDGPLQIFYQLAHLIFSQLAHLAAMAVPFDQTGLERKDIEKVWELQKKVLKDSDKRLPLNSASDSVWEALRQLQNQVNDLCGKVTGKDRQEDRVILRRLHRMIKEVYALRSFGSKDPGQSGPAGEQGLRTSPAVILTSPSGESPGIIEDSFGSASFLLTPRASIHLLPERLADKEFDHASERETYVLSESPQSYASSLHSLPLRHPTPQVIPGVGIIDLPIATSPSANIPMISFAHTDDRGARHRRSYTSTRRTGSGLSAPRPNLLTPTSTGAIFASPMNSPTLQVLPNPTIRSSYGFFDLSVGVQSGAAPSSRPPSRP